VALVNQALCLFGHEVSNHVGFGGKGCGDIAQFDMLATEVDALNVNMARSRLVGRLERQGDGAFVVAEERGRK
jgi:hypothetical protein